jgi:hypothetical protein
LKEVFFYGNVPTSVSWNAFDYPSDGTVYYLPGTSGWDATFAGHPTALWLPAMQSSDGSFGMQTNQFGFNIQWAIGQTVVVEACTNLGHPGWQPVQTNTLMSGSVYFSDPHWTNYFSRFYRLRSP